MVQIIPAILSKTEEDFKRDISKYNFSPAYKDSWVHIDFMDNYFVPNKSIKPSVLAGHEIRLEKEAHLMVSKPMEWIDQTVKAGFKRIFIHLEAEDVGTGVDTIKKRGLEVGLAVNLETPIEKLTPFLDKIDRVLLMSIHPGFQGQELLPDVYERIKLVFELRKESGASFKIGVDGGIKDTNAKQLIETGVNFLIVGSYLLKGDVDANLEKIWEEIKN